MSYSDIVSTIALVVSFIAVPASGVISFHYAIKGEKRKEFNEVADPFREMLMDLKESVMTKKTIGSIGHKPRIDENLFSKLVERTEPEKCRERLVKSWENYKKKECDLIVLHQNKVNFIVTDRDDLLSAIKSLEPFCARK